MNQLLIVCYVFSMIAAIALFRKIGIRWALVVAFGLPCALFAIAALLLKVGGDS